MIFPVAVKPARHINCAKAFLGIVKTITKWLERVTTVFFQVGAGAKKFTPALKTLSVNTSKLPRHQKRK